MNCTQAEESLSQWMDGELQPAVEPELFTHLGICERCRAFNRELFMLNQELSTSRNVKVPVLLDKRVLEKNPSKINLARSFSWIRPGRMYSFRVIGLAVLVSIITTIFVSSFWYRNSQQHQAIVCLTPLPEVEVNGYVVIASSPIKGINQ